MTEKEEIKNKIIETLKSYGIKKASLFGSITRDDFNENSDVDVLVEIPESITMDIFDFISIKLELEKSIDRKVDLIEYKNIKNRFREKILANQAILYEQTHN